MHLKSWLVMVFILATEEEGRCEVLANFKNAYALRSKQVHHLTTVDDEKTLSQFFVNAWLRAAISSTAPTVSFLFLSWRRFCNQTRA